MRGRRILLVAVFVAAVLVGILPIQPAAAAPVGKGPVGWDTYRQLNRLPYLGSAVKTLQSSSFDRAGGNDDGGGTCLQFTSAGCVIAQDSGPGEISSIWFTRDNGVVTAMGNIRIELDGSTVLDSSLQTVVNGGLGAPFVYPLVANGDQSPGGVYIKVPMTYRSSMRVTVQSAVAYYHVDYRHFPDAGGVSTFDRSDQAQDVLSVLRAAGTSDPKPASPGAQTSTNTVTVGAGGSTTVAQLTGPATVSALRLQFSSAPTEGSLAGLRLRISFDGRSTVDSPVGEFFGSGIGPSTVRSLLFASDPAAGGWFSTWWPMPFAQNATVSLLNTTGAAITGINTQITTAPDPQWTTALADGSAGYFTARSTFGATAPDQDWVFADESGHGKFVGVSAGMRGTQGGSRGYLEGDERVYVDGSQSPQLYGTGTEDFYEGGWYFRAGVQYSDPFTGQPRNIKPDGSHPNDSTATYRLMLGDSVAYQTALRFGIEHGERNNIPGTYSSTAFLYTQTTSTAVQGDRIEATDPSSRSSHNYSDSNATEAALSSSYEGTGDSLPVNDRSRSTSQPITFTLKVNASNNGVLLRRTSDQNTGYQSAAVSVDGTAVGTWLEPRSNPRQRWLSDSYALPASATTGKSSITVTLTPTGPWNAVRYAADAIVPAYANNAAPAAVTGLTVIGVRHAVRLQWSEPSSGTGVGLYRIYSSTSPDVPVNSGTLIGTSRTASYVQMAVPGKQTRYYRVVAVEPGGLAAVPSAVVSATTKVRTRNDFNGDGKDDVLTFVRGSAATAYGAISTGTAFSGDGVLVASGVAPGAAVPLTGDADGDGRTDIIWFVRGSNPTVYVQLSNGATFGAPQLWHNFFALDSEIPLVGDFNGDGKDDIATFTRGASYGPGQVYVALSTGTSFVGTSTMWDTNFGYGTEPPAVGDFNGDGMDDIATFSQGTTGHVYVALSNGSRFLGNGEDNLWNNWFAPAGETPAVGDFNGDGRDDIVTFTQANPAKVYVGLSTGRQFSAGAVWNPHFSVAGEVPGTGDFDGDGKSDIVTFTRGSSAQVYVSLSNGASFVQDSWLWHSHFCVGTEWPQPSRLLP